MCDELTEKISEDDILIELLDQALSAGRLLKGKIFEDTSTVYPDTSELAARRLSMVQHSSLLPCSVLVLWQPLGS